MKCQKNRSCVKQPAYSLPDTRPRCTGCDDAKAEVFPRQTLDGTFYCQCGGQLMTEYRDCGNFEERDSYRVHCKWCPASSRWLNYESDAYEELINGMKERRIIE